VYCVVLPLSAAVVGSGPKPLPVNGLLIHMVGVGVPVALFGAPARQSREVS
jgi:hypothetical protein